MRTLFEIIDSAKDGNKPTEEECYWAMLALSYLHFFDHQTLLEFGYGVKDPNGIFGLKYQANESHNRFKKALNKSPQEYVGWNNDPSNPDYQRRRKIGEKILAKVVSKS